VLRATWPQHSSWQTCYWAESWWQWFCRSVTLCLFCNMLMCHKASAQFWQFIQTADTWSLAKKTVFCPIGSINMLCYPVSYKEVHGSAVCHKIFLADWRCTLGSWQAMEQLPSIASLTGTTACHCWFMYLFCDFFIIKPTRCTNFTNLFCHETLHVSDNSSVHHQEFIRWTLSNGICHTGL